MDGASLALALAWLAASVLAAARALAVRRPLWGAVALASALLASLARWHWHADVYQAGRRLLRSLGAYSDRIFVKLALFGVGATLLLALALFAGRRFARLSRGPQLAVVGLLLQAVFYAMLVASLNDLFPLWLREGPGRVAFGGACAGFVVLGAALGSKERPADEEDDED